jgi:poly(3-hydroxybutyrate) depolymerase
MQAVNGEASGMLYQLRESMHQIWAPWRDLAGAAAATSRNGHTPTEIERSLLAGYELFERITRRYEKPAFNLSQTMIWNEPVAVVEEIRHEKPFGNLVHFRREGEFDDPRVLIVPPTAGHFSTLVRGTIEALLPEHDIYLVDWTNARDIPKAAGSFDLDDYIAYLIEFLHELGPGTHVLGICQAAVPAFAAAAVISASEPAYAPSSVTLMAGPIDGREHPTQVNRFATSRSIHWFEDVMVDRVPSAYPGAGRLVYPGFIQLTAFMGMNPDRHMAAHVRFFEDLVAGDEVAAETHRLFYDEYLSVMDITAEFYLQTVRSVFQEFDLPRGVMKFRGDPIDPAAITTTALMTVEGERDDITGRGQTEAAQSLSTNLAASKRRHLLQPGVGHFGVFSGRRWRNEIMPQLRDFIREHDRRD